MQRLCPAVRVLVYLCHLKVRVANVSKRYKKFWEEIAQTVCAVAIVSCGLYTIMSHLGAEFRSQDYVNLQR